jgi:hypothetical protein
LAVAAAGLEDLPALLKMVEPVLALVDLVE